jgi:hypothetical protein
MLLGLIIGSQQTSDLIAEMLHVGRLLRLNPIGVVSFVPLAVPSFLQMLQISQIAADYLIQTLSLLAGRSNGDHLLLYLGTVGCLPSQDQCEQSAAFVVALLPQQLSLLFLKTIE